MSSAIFLYSYYFFTTDKLLVLDSRKQGWKQKAMHKSVKIYRQKL